MSTRKAGGGVGEMIRTIVLAVLIALGIRTFAYEPFNIPSGSMIPTLLVGDYLFVSKLSYGYSRHSLPFSPPLMSGRLFFTEPVRGDVAVFKKPTDTAIDFIKRIMGLPGDTIQVRRGIVHINGKPLKRERVDDFIGVDYYGRPVRTAQYRETLPNGREHLILEQLGDTSGADNTPPFSVPAGHYFMMGDNRDNSVDSRTIEVGFVPRENLVGRAEILFFSTDGTAEKWEIWKWPLAIRFVRLFQGIT
jgi:signal peptidase I